MPNLVEQAQLTETMAHKCYLRTGTEWRVEVNCGYIWLCVHTVMPLVLSGVLQQLLMNLAMILHHQK